MSKLTKSRGEIFTAILLIILACGSVFAYSRYAAQQNLSDFAAYWTAAKLFKTNPFDLETVSSFQARLAMNREDVLVMRNPPWTAVLLMPLSLFPYDVATGIWTTLTFLLLAGAGLSIWRHLGGTDGTIGLAIVFAFAPTLLLLRIGQISAVLLASIAVLMFALQKERYALAGFALVGLTVKPHVCLIAIVVVLLWALLSKRHVLWLSFAAGMSGLALISLALNNDIFKLYWQLVRTIVGYQETYPNLAGALISATGIRELGFLPLAIGIGYECYRLSRGAAAWQWHTELPRVLLISLLTSFYSYSYDEVLVLPALMTAFLNGRRSVWILGSAITSGGILLYLRGLVPAGYLFMWWTGSAWALTVALSTFLGRGTGLRMG